MPYPWLWTEQIFKISAGRHRYSFLYNNSMNWASSVLSGLPLFSPSSPARPPSSTGVPAPTLTPLPAPSTERNSAGGCPVTGRCLTRHVPETAGRRGFVFPLHPSPGRVLPRLTGCSVPSKYRPDVQTRPLLRPGGNPGQKYPFSPHI